MGAWSNFISGAGKQLAENLINMPFQAWSMNRQYNLNEQAANNADMRQRKQFQDMYSLNAQMKQVKDAGLSPSIMFGGMPSQGGANAPQGAGVQSNFRGATLNPTELAQIEVAKSQANLNNAEAKKVEKDTTKTDSEIGLINAQTQEVFASIGLKNAQEANTRACTEWQELQTFITDATLQEQINEIVSRSNKAFTDSQIALQDLGLKENELEISEKTLNENIKLIKQELANTEQQYWNLMAQEDLTKEQINELKALTRKYIYDVEEAAWRMQFDYGKFQTEIAELNRRYKLDVKNYTTQRMKTKSDMSQGLVRTVFGSLGDLVGAGFLNAKTNALVKKIPKKK